ncbi:MAG: phosphate acyltransferase PlsX [Thermoanaerobacteraceae bacterium]|nr:phosphate acyltransferase PlsX [Thermoanaerobacteraceae bacterium]
MKILVDAMGGDKAPEEVVKGAIEASKDLSSDIILIGNRDKITPHLAKADCSLEIIHAEEIITNDEQPVNAIRKKKDSSIVKGLRLLKEGKVQAMVSAGSTGALMAGGLFVVGRIEGIDRPAIATVFPTPKGPMLLLDIGANSEVKPKNLVQFALMGNIYAEEILGIQNPSVGLMNIGVEEEKGTSTIKTAYSDLKQIDSINFIGNIEVRDMFDGNVNVVVCDGFTGNIFLKTLEGFGTYIFNRLKEEVKSNITYSIGAMILKPALNKVKASLDYSEYGGAMFLGIDGVLIKCHGTSDSKAIANGIKAAHKFARADISKKLKQNLKLNVEKEK